MSDAYARAVRRRAVFGDQPCSFPDETAADVYAREPAAIHTLPQSRPKPRRGVSALTVLAGVLAMGFLTGALYGRIQLTALNEEAVAAAASIRALREEQAVLSIRYGETFNLAQIERYALEELGMQRPYGIREPEEEILLPDQVTLFPENRRSPMEERLYSFLDSIGAYFH